MSPFALMHTAMARHVSLYLKAPSRFYVSIELVYTMEEEMISFDLSPFNPNPQPVCCTHKFCGIPITLVTALKGKSAVTLHPNYS